VSDGQKKKFKSIGTNGGNGICNGLFVICQQTFISRRLDAVLVENSAR
jgi:hypothetical protein